MSRLRRIVTLIFALVTLGTLGLGSPHLLAQDLQLIFGDDGFALLYTKVVGTYVTVQLSTDLRYWTTTYPLDEVQSGSDGTQVIKSRLGTTGEQMFFRLLVSPARTVTVTWDAVPSPEIAGYHVYYRGEKNDDFPDADGSEREIDVGNSTFASVSLPVDAREYYLAVTSYTAAGVESDRSAEVTVPR